MVDDWCLASNSLYPFSNGLLAVTNSFFILRVMKYECMCFMLSGGMCFANPTSGTLQG